MSAGRLARRLAGEPLVQFLAAGLAVFFISASRGSEVDPADRTVVISENQVTRLSADFEQTWARAPSPAELDALIADHVREEIYYREAKRLGLDEDDPVIRRRLRSKMEFLAGAEIESAAPDDKALQALIDQNPERYAAEPIFSFDQIYLGADDDAHEITESLSRLQGAGGADWTTLGEAISLPRSLENSAKSAVARDFGDDFANALAAQAQDVWSGPVRSGFGFHLVRVREVIPSRMTGLNEVRQLVENDWRAATLRAREEEAYEALRASYAIRVEGK